MEHEASFDCEDEHQFWTVLEEILSKDCHTHDGIDETLRSYLSLISTCRERFLGTDHDLARCTLRLHGSRLYAVHAEYIRRQFIQSLLEDDEPDVVLVSASFLLADAHTHERTYELLNDEGAFPRLVDLISSPKRHGREATHRLLMELLYEMSRIQKIRIADLAHVGDEFVQMLFDIIEQVSDDVNDPYHYPTIRVLLVLNEQFMVTAHDPAYTQGAITLTNKVVKVLSTQGSLYKTFGENIILLLNREDETSLQLLTLKLLYLLFTTPPTYEYFYTNDLRVLVDILIRNLLDLPEEASSLRHTYLRVLYPLLEHTQLQYPPHYKRDEIHKLLLVLRGSHLAELVGEPNGSHHWGHFDDVDETTKRLVARCERVSWLAHSDLEPPMQGESPVDDVASNPSSPTSPVKAPPPALPAPRKLTKRNSSKVSALNIGQYLTPQLDKARQSSLSMMEVAAQREKPGVITPSRNPTLKHNLRAAIMHKKESKPPPPPQARRSGWARRATEADIVRVADSNADTEARAKAENHLLALRQPRHLSLIPTTRAAEKERGSSPTLREPPPVPSHHKGPFRKPPPTPKARRWRGKEVAGAAGSREPGKFNASLPSIVPATAASHDPPEPNPFSPLDKTFSFGDPDEPSPQEPAESKVKSSVSEALERVQAQALEDITETLDQVHLKTGPSDAANEQEAPESKVQEATGIVLLEGHARTDHQRPGLDRAFSHDEFHDAVDNQALSHPVSPLHQAADEPKSDVPDSDPDPTPSAITPTPSLILTPPAQEPLRGVPGPQYELERSPFLTDDEGEGERGADENDSDEEER